MAKGKKTNNSKTNNSKNAPKGKGKAKAKAQNQKAQKKNQKAKAKAKQLEPEEIEEEEEVEEEVEEEEQESSIIALVFYEGDDEESSMVHTTDPAAYVTEQLGDDVDPDDLEAALEPYKVALLIQDGVVLQADGEEIEWEDASTLFEVRASAWTLALK